MTALLLAVLLPALSISPAFGGSLDVSTTVRSGLSGTPRRSVRAAWVDSSTTGADTTAGTIVGRLAADDSSPPLAFAAVEAEGPGGYRLVHADAVGAYRMSGLEPGVWRLSAHALDYASTKVRVTLPAGGHVKLDLALDLRPLSLPSLKIAATPGITGESLSAADWEADARKPGRSVDLVSLSPAGASATVGLSSAARGVLAGAPQTKASTLYVPAAARDGGRVLLDGAPVVAPVELAGLLSAFPAGVRGTVEIDRAGAPARFETGGLGLLRLATRKPRRDRVQASGCLGQLSSSLRAEGPLGGGDFVLGARTLSAGEPAFLAGSGGSLPYGYADGLARVDLPAGPGTVSATGFWNRESLRGPASAGSSLLAWGNAAASVRYQVPLGRGGMRFHAAVGRFRTSVPWGDAGRHLRERSFDALAAVDAFGHAGLVDLAGGLAWEGTRVTRLSVDSAAGAPAVPAVDLAGGVASPYLEADVHLTRALSLRAGLRADASTYGALGWDPRIRLEWRTGRRLSLYAAAGRSHELAEREAVTGCDPASGACGPSRLSLDGVSHVAAGLSARPAPRLTLGLDAYIADYIEPVTGLNARSTGAELRGGWRGDNWSAWVDYALASARAAWPDDDASGGRIEQRLLAGLSAGIPPGVHVTLRMQMSAGLPYTPLPMVGSMSPGGTGSGYPRPVANPPGSSGQESMLAVPGSWTRVDGTVSRSWRAHLFGAEVRLTPYLELLNAAGTRDAPFYWAGSGSGQRPVGTVPLMAAAGLRWGF